MGKSLNGKELGKGIVQDKNGVFRARFVNRFGKTVVIRSASLTEIRKKLMESKYEDYSKSNLSNPELTLAEWYNIWMETYEISIRDSTRHQYDKMFEKVKEDIGSIKMKDLNTTVIQQALNNLPSDAYRKRIRSILHSMLEKAVEDNILTRNPAKKARWNVAHDSKIPKKPMTFEQEQLFVNYIYKPRCKQSKLEHVELFEFMLETGMRLGEATGLEWKSVDFEEGIIYVNTNLVTTMAKESDGTVKGRYPRFHYPKTEMGKRKIPMTDRARELLVYEMERDKRIKKEHKPLEGFEDLVFVTWLNTPIYDDTIRRSLQKISRELREIAPTFPSVSPHILRHTFATRCVENGVNIKTLQIILGHSNFKTTMDTYAHTTDDILMSEIKKFEGRKSEEQAKDENWPKTGQNKFEKLEILMYADEFTKTS